MFCRNTTLHHREVSIMKADIAASALKKRYNVTRNVWHIHLCNFIHQIFSLFSSWEKSECLLYGYTTLVFKVVIHIASIKQYMMGHEIESIFHDSNDR